jgi:transcriptional regulator with XRE-family HTH domain
MTATIGDDLRRHELAAFLRSRRERITPEQAGLPPGGRRRTPGLRREEVAQLAGVGVTWYTWLEQGRDINASDQVLDSIADTLQLDPHERAHMFTLAGSPRVVAVRECVALSSSIHAIMRQLEPMPAVVVNPRLDMLGFNRAYERLFDLDEIPLEDRNSILLLFTHPRWRTMLLDWQDAVPTVVAQFRTMMASHVAEPWWKALLKRLLAESPEFEALWNRHDVTPVENRTKRFMHPRAGLLAFDYTHLYFGPGSQTRLSTYTPSNEDSWTKMSALVREFDDTGILDRV